MHAIISALKEQKIWGSWWASWLISAVTNHGIEYLLTSMMQHLVLTARCVWDEVWLPFQLIINLASQITWAVCTLKGLCLWHYGRQIICRDSYLFSWWRSTKPCRTGCCDKTLLTWAGKEWEILSCTHWAVSPFLPSPVIEFFLTFGKSPDWPGLYNPGINPSKKRKHLLCKLLQRWYTESVRFRDVSVWRYSSWPCVSKWDSFTCWVSL